MSGCLSLLLERLGHAGEAERDQRGRVWDA